jgi:hypothetical protein
MQESSSLEKISSSPIKLQALPEIPFSGSAFYRNRDGCSQVQYEKIKNSIVNDDSLILIFCLQNYSEEVLNAREKY